MIRPLPTRLLRAFIVNMHALKLPSYPITFTEVKAIAALNVHGTLCWGYYIDPFEAWSYMTYFSFERDDAGKTGKNVDWHGLVATACRSQSEELPAKMRFSGIDNSSVNPLKTLLCVWTIFGTDTWTKMWQEARKQEKKLRGMMVDYRKRAERRRAFYERMVWLPF